MALQHAGEDHDVVRDHAQRQAVGGRPRQGLQAHDAAGTRLVVDDHRVPQGLGQRVLNGRPRDGVNARAGGVGQDEAHRLVGLARSAGQAASGGQRHRPAGCGGSGQWVMRVRLLVACRQRGSGHDAARSRSKSASVAYQRIAQTAQQVGGVRRPGAAGRAAPAGAWPSIVIGKQRGLHGAAGLVAIGAAPTSARPPVASRCGSSYRSSGLRIGA